MTSLIIKRQTIANMESDMDRWIQDRDRLSKQLEKCQMKYDNATVLQKVRIVWTSHIRFILTTALKCILSCDRNCFLFLVAEIELSLLFHNQEYLYHNNVRQKKKNRVLNLELANVGLLPVFEVNHLWKWKLVLKIRESKNRWQISAKYLLMEQC